ncbi:MAG: MMPL family transporter [Bifidobacteriaceae bacterium]|jgi:RND superfamily putative drug exporter|nr:MMPL family transporter [Bifidobacteriaceae bacterium]
MARTLYRLGHFSARHRLAVIIGWLLTLVAAVTAYLVAGGSLSSSFDIPGTATSEVSAELSEQLPELAGVSANVVFQSETGASLDTDQRAQISRALDSIRTVSRVRAVVDPFAAEAAKTAAAAQAVEGRHQLEQAAAELDAGAAELRDARQRIETAIAQLQTAISQPPSNPANPGTTPDQPSSMPDAVPPDPAVPGWPTSPEEMALALVGLEEQLAQLDAQWADIEAGQTALEQQEVLLNQAEQLIELAEPIRTVAADGATAVATVMFENDMFTLPQESKDQVRQRIASAQLTAVRTDYSFEIAQSTSGLIGLGEALGVGAAAIVLLVLLRTALAALAPIVSSLVGAGIGIAGAMALSDVLDMTQITPVLGIMLGLAVGIDYSLFIIQRHRRQLLAGTALTESILLATSTAGYAVVSAGATVIIALAALNLCGIPFLGLMGWVGAVCVAIAVLAAVTLTPALLSLLGARVLPRRQRQSIPSSDGAPTRSGGAKPADTSGKPARGDRPPKVVPTWRSGLQVAVGIGLLAVIALPALSLRLGLPFGSSEPPDSTSYRAFSAVAEEFGVGVNGPLVVAARPPTPVGADGLVGAQATIATQLMSQPDVAAVAPAGANADGSFLAFQVIPVSGPDSQATEALVNRLRGLTPLADGTKLGVAGQASSNIDISAKLADGLPLYLIVVVGLSLAIMVVVFRSLLLPVIAAAGFVLSYFAALGATVAIYQWGWLGAVFGVHEPGPILSFLPLLLVGVVFGLAMDYQLFLGSAMRQAYAAGTPSVGAVGAGLAATRAVVVAGALIMIAVFGGFVSSHLAMVRPLGFGLAVGVLCDAFVVRLMVVPALMRLAGGAVWWLPGWLKRALR